MKKTTSLSLVPSVLLIVFLIGFPQISETIYTPALSNIASDLKTTSVLTQWTLSIYFIGFALGVFYWGRLSDRIGRRPTMLLGLLIYGLANLICFMSPNITVLLLARFVQAFGASVGSVITLTIARESFNDVARQKLFATIGAALSLTPAIGPFIGGYVSDWFGWRANFVVLILMTVGLYRYTHRRLPETKPDTEPHARPIKMTQAIYQLITDGRVLGCVCIIGAINSVLFGYYAEAPFIFIKVVGISSGEYGWMGLFIAVASTLGSLISHKLSDRWTGQQMAYSGCLIMMVSSLLLCVFAWFNFIEPDHVLQSIFCLMLPMAGMILGSCSLTLPVVLSTALNKYKPLLGTASAIFGLGYYLLISIGTAIMGLIHDGTVLPMPVYFVVLSLLTTVAYYWVANREE